MAETIHVYIMTVVLNVSNVSKQLIFEYCRSHYYTFSE